MMNQKTQSSHYLAGLFLLFAFCFQSAAFSQIPTCPGDGFGGNNQVNISAISPQIFLADSIGEAPFGVYASAFQTTGTGSTDPFSDIEYTWDFGDTSASGNQVFPHPVDQSPMSPNTDQGGPEASYLYQKPGTFIITLTARAWNGTGYTTATTQKTVTVSSWSGQDRYVDPTGGNDGNTGTSAGNAWKSWSKMVSWLDGGNSRRALLKRGDSLMATSSLVTKKSGLRIGAYGSGNRPIIKTDVSLTNGNVLYINGTNTVVSDHVYTDIVIDAASLASTIYFGYSDLNGKLDRVTFANCQFKNGHTSTMILTTGSGPKRSMMLWDCEINSNLGDKQGLYVYNTPYFSVVGGRFDGGNGNVILDHHMYINQCNHSLLRWADFGQAVARNFCLNMNAPSFNSDMEYVLIDGCDITGTTNGIDFSNGNNDNTGHFTHSIVQNCAIHDLTSGAQGLGVFGYSVRDLTIRNNRFFNNPIADLDIRDSDMVYNVYLNKFYTSASLAHTAINIASGQRGVFRDNQFVNEGSSEGHFAGDLSTTANWVIEGNQYWHPSINTPFYESNTGSSLDFSGWQGLGFDLNGTVSNPLFPDPANGDFGQLPLADFTALITLDSVAFTNQTTLNPIGWPIDYSWDFGDGSNLDTSTNPLHVYNQSGTYPVILSASNACGTDTSLHAQTVTVVINAVEDILESVSVRAWPNPAKGFLMVSGLPRQADGVQLKVYDLNYRQVVVPPHTVESGTLKMDTHNLPSGLYFLRLQTENWQKTIQFLRQ